MVRTIISLNEKDKDWLDRRSEEEGVPMTELVRRAVALLRAQVRETDPPLSQLLEETSGIWSAGDGLSYQTRGRDEW
jgi:hypothetical protein